MRKELIYLNILAWILVVIGAINWGLIGFFQFDLVAAIFGGQGAIVSRIIYALVGLAGLWSIMLFSRIRGRDRDRDK
jgi:uncharacterized protein